MVTPGAEHDGGWLMEERDTSAWGAWGGLGIKLRVPEMEPACGSHAVCVRVVLCGILFLEVLPPGKKTG